ncbi:GH20451 [Drosophila grimshawi]|uniref:GH20451 n=2 Tax=Drosophila grimshawi TaxID=7222 RepID=B4J9G3_DROGR|nr:GH20451 [Drosophila grimshawi]
MLEEFAKLPSIKPDNSDHLIDCFNTYILLVNQVAEGYKAEFAQCLSTADENHELFEENMKDKRTEIDNTATGACAALSNCSNNTGSVDYFECYANTAGNTAKTMYSISANSGELLTAVQEELRLIDHNRYICTNASERALREKQAVIYEDFNRCISGLEPLGPTNASSPAPTTIIDDANDDESD